jgi:pimeloyl-ACP methyl ester carboxylesterase
MRRAALSLAAALGLSGAGAAAQTDPGGPMAAYLSPQQLVPVGPGRTINLVCRGQGVPTVILTAGGGAWSSNWVSVQPALARQTRVCAWDRAGNGFSTASPQPQDIAHTEADLEAALAGGGVTGPLVLVGHSLGGFDSLLFADRHPDRVVGMVLIDPSYPDQIEGLARAAPELMAYSNQADGKGLERYRQCIAALKSGSTTPPPDACQALRRGYPEAMRNALLPLTTDPAYWRTFLSSFELKDLNARLAINAHRSYGALPLVVLGSGELSLPGAPAEVGREIPNVQAEIQRGHMALVALSSRGSYVRVPNAGHAIQNQKPGVVIDAITQVIDQARRSAPPP